MEVVGPLALVLQCGRVAARDTDQHSHGIHLMVRRVHLSQLNAGDARTPHIGLQGGEGRGGEGEGSRGSCLFVQYLLGAHFVVVGGVSTDLTGNDFRGHPAEGWGQGGWEGPGRWEGVVV